MPKHPTGRKRPTRGRPRKPHSESYDVEVVEWHLRYSLSGAVPYDFVREAFWEYLDLVICGRFLSPPRLAGDLVDIRVEGRRRYDDVMTDPVAYRDKAEWVGWLNARGKTRQLLVSIPWTAAWGLCPALQAGAVRVISTHGEPLYRGEAKIRSIAFCRELELETAADDETGASTGQSGV